MTTAAAIIVGGVGAIVLTVGWWGGVDIVTRVLPNLVSMKANTAVGFILAGVALHPVIARRRPWLARVAAALLLLLGAATIVEYLVGVDLGIDQLLAADTVLYGTSEPGRMGLNTAIAFASLGLVVWSVQPGVGDRARRFGQVLAVAVGLLSLLAFLGYVLGASSAVGLGSATEMALHTSAMLLIAAVGAGAATSNVGLLRVLSSPTDTGRSARVLLPVLIAALMLVGAVVEILSRTTVLEDPRLQLALGSTGGVLVVGLGTLLGLRFTERAEMRADATRRDLEAVRAAFPDVHLRLGADDTVRAVHGEIAAHRIAPAAVGAPFAQVLPDGIGRSLLLAVAEARAGGTMVEVSYDMPGTDDQFEARLVPMGEGEVAVAIRDVSELAHAQAELRSLAAGLEVQVNARTRELEASNRALERFAYLASHDLQEPLRMVTGFVGRIASRYGDLLDDRGKEYVHYAVDGADRMSKLIDGLLEYSRAGQVDPARLVPTDLAKLVPQVAQTMEGAVADAAGSLTQDLQPAVVAGDPTLLRQVIQNLLSNGLKFTRSDVAPSVTIRTRSIATGGQVIVEDAGIGIAPEQREEVFAMFRRVSTDPAHRGTGIGLSLVQQMVDAHRGRIDVSDGPGGVGTRFTVTIPYPKDPLT